MEERLLTTEPARHLRALLPSYTELLGWPEDFFSDSAGVPGARPPLAGLNWIVSRKMAVVTVAGHPPPFLE
jgi:hypothetical protein